MANETEESDNELFEVLPSYGDLDIEELDDDSGTIEKDNSETSEDHRVAASESVGASYSEDELLGSSLSHIQGTMNGPDASSAVGKKISTSVVASRLASEDGILVARYLVLWQSWEREMSHEYDVSEDLSS